MASFKIMLGLICLCGVPMVTQAYKDTECYDHTECGDNSFCDPTISMCLSCDHPKNKPYCEAYIEGYNEVKNTPSPPPPSTDQTDYVNTILEPQAVKSDNHAKVGAYKSPVFAATLLFVGVFLLACIVIIVGWTKGHKWRLGRRRSPVVQETDIDGDIDGTSHIYRPFNLGSKPPKQANPVRRSREELAINTATRPTPINQIATAIASAWPTPGSQIANGGNLSGNSAIPSNPPAHNTNSGNRASNNASRSNPLIQNANTTTMRLNPVDISLGASSTAAARPCLNHQNARGGYPPRNAMRPSPNPQNANSGDLSTPTTVRPSPLRIPTGAQHIHERSRITESLLQPHSSSTFVDIPLNDVHTGGRQNPDATTDYWIQTERLLSDNTEGTRV